MRRTSSAPRSLPHIPPTMANHIPACYPPKLGLGMSPLERPLGPSPTLPNQLSGEDGGSGWDIQGLCECGEVGLFSGKLAKKGVAVQVAQKAPFGIRPQTRPIIIVTCQRHN